MIKINRYKKPAFTMIEMIMAIIVIGILAAVALPNLSRDIRQEAGDNILSAVRYTQHLALIDKKQRFNDNKWQKMLWHLRFSRYDEEKSHFYTISSNMDKNTNVDKIETAIDPSTGKYFYHLGGDSTLDESDESPSIFITKKYGIKSIKFEGGCKDGRLIAFDHLGRPHVGIYGGSNDYHTYMKTACTLTFDFADSDLKPLSINILPETGYAFIVGQNKS